MCSEDLQERYFINVENEQLSSDYILNGKREMFQFTRYFQLLWYMQFTYDAHLKRAANVKDYATFKYLRDHMWREEESWCLQLLYLLGSS